MASEVLVPQYCNSCELVCFSSAVITLADVSRTSLGCCGVHALHRTTLTAPNTRHRSILVCFHATVGPLIFVAFYVCTYALISNKYTSSTNKNAQQLNTQRSCHLGFTYQMTVEYSSVWITSSLQLFHDTVACPLASRNSPHGTRKSICASNHACALPHP